MNDFIPNGIRTSYVYLLTWIVIAALWWPARVEAEETYEDVIKRAINESLLNNWEEAQVAFQKAYELRPGPRPLRGLGIAFYKQKRYAETIEALEKALAIKGSQYPLTERLRKSAEKVLIAARDYVATVHIQLEPQEAELWVDGQQTSKRTLLMNSGEHMLEAVYGEQRQRKNLTVRLGEERQVRFTFDGSETQNSYPAPKEQIVADHRLNVSDNQTNNSDDADTEGFRVGTPALVSLIVAGAGIITASAFGLLALDEYNDLKSEGGCASSCTEDEVSSLDTYDLVADVGLGVAIAGAITGTILMILDNDSEEKSIVSIKNRLGSVKGETRFGVKF